MRLIVFFDLPVETSAQRRAYARFRKYLLKSGFLMLQESVYSKLAIDGKMVDVQIKRLRENRPPEGLVQALQVTEKQFAGMISIAGRRECEETVDSINSLVVI